MNTKTIIIITTLAILMLSAVSCKKEINAPAGVQKFDLKSKGNLASYPVKVALPDNFDTHKHYATVYVLDGEENFNFVAYQCKQISNSFSKDNVLVVSIGYGLDRANDYTPTNAAEGDGGAPAFMDFIADELIPYMESNFAADTNRNSRVILGHSFGGLFAAYAFAKHNRTFGNYLMLSPSLWYDNEILLQYEQDNRNDNQTEDQLLFLGIGQMENAGRMQAPFKAFSSRISSFYTATKFQENTVARLDHVGSKNPNIIKGLEFYFQNK